MNGAYQINKFGIYTNNFTNLDVLTPDEILYLNLCNWLHTYAQEINSELKTNGRIHLVDQVQGVETYFDQFDIFTSLLGEKEPGSITSITKSGHLTLPELQAALFDFGSEMKAFGDGFLYMNIKDPRSLLNKYKSNAYFPYGNMPKDCSDMILQAIQDPQLVECCDISPNGRYTFNVINQSGQKFRIYVQDNIARFHPMNSFTQQGQ